MPTIKSALAEAVNRLQDSTDSPLLDVEILLCKVLEKDRSYLRAWPERELTNEIFQDFKSLVTKRQQGEPVAYLTGVREFWSREFAVTGDVLIPRPETELLIELSLNLIPVDRPWHILDLGTGSGILAITLAAERPLTKVIAADISHKALYVAQENAKRHQVNNIQFFESHWFENIPQQKFDLIVSNPPYLAENDTHLQEGDLRFEPIHALVSGQSGLEDIEHITLTARQWLKNGAHLMFEHGYNQKSEVQRIFQSLGYQYVNNVADLSNQPRVTYAQYLLLK